MDLPALLPFLQERASLVCCPGPGSHGATRHGWHSSVTHMGLWKLSCHCLLLVACASPFWSITSSGDSSVSDRSADLCTSDGETSPQRGSRNCVWFLSYGLTFPGCCSDTTIIRPPRCSGRLPAPSALENRLSVGSLLHVVPQVRAWFVILCFYIEPASAHSAFRVPHLDVVSAL